jgi:PKD repeat protein
VSGAHTYADEGTFSVTVQITDTVSTTTAVATSTATVAESDALTAHPVTFPAIASVPFTGTVATFTDASTVNVPADFTAIIDWGDATTTAGTVAGGGGSFSVSGTHTYAAPGTFTVSVTLTDDAPGTATATATSTANVEAAPVIAQVPTLDWRGLATLSLALAGVALLLLRKV